MTSIYSEVRPKVKAEDERNRVWIFGTPISHSVAPSLFDVIFPALGLPKFKYGISDCKTLDDPNASWHVEMKQPYALGSCVTMPLKLAVMPFVDELTPAAKAIGSVNTTYFRKEDDDSVTHVGTNLDTAGVGNSLLTALTGTPTPFHPDTPLKFQPGKAAALMIGGGGATRAAIYAMNKMDLSPIYLINRDPSETKATIEQFPQWDLRALNTVEEATAALQELDSKGVKLCAGVGAIPSIEPQSPAEKSVYEIAKMLFSHKYSVAGTPKEFMAIPETPVFLEMAYKPRMTLMRGVAEERGWKTICGVEVVLEGCFEQTYLWTGQVVPFEVREAGRKVLRGE